MLKQLLKTQKEYLDNFFDSVDLSKAEKVLELMEACKGSLFFSGVGKSGIIAEKLAMTMISIGTKAFYLPPTNALHGDIGILGKEDLFIFLSKSGETKELLSLLPFVKQRGVQTLAWVSRSSSSLAKRCDYSMILPLKRELCPFNLAPTTSAVIQLVFGDVLAVALMKRKSFSLTEYAKNHPAGSIGSELTNRVSDVMIQGSDLPICYEKDRLKDVLVELTNKRCGCLIVVNKQSKIQGIFTDGDLRRALQNKPEQVMNTAMKSLMTTNFLSVRPENLVNEAKQLMQKVPGKWVMMLPVLQDQTVVGLVRMHDIVNRNL